MKSILIITLLIINIINKTECHKNILLYKINQDKSIYIQDNLNKISYVNKNNENNIQNDDMFSLLYNNEKYLLLGSINKILNYSIENEFKLLNTINFTNQFSNYVKVGIPLEDEEENSIRILISCAASNMNKAICRKQSLEINSIIYTQPSLYQIPKSIQNTQNIAAFAYSNSIYYFHSHSQTQDIYKQNYNLNKQTNDVEFNQLIRTPLGAIKSKIYLKFFLFFYFKIIFIFLFRS